MNVSAAISLALGLVFFYLSMFVLHTYEKHIKKGHPAVKFWPFNREMMGYYPGLPKIGRFLQIGSIVCSLPLLLNLGFCI